MSYYNRNYKKIKLSAMEYLNSGECAKVFYNKYLNIKIIY